MISSRIRNRRNIRPWKSTIRTFASHSQEGWCIGLMRGNSQFFRRKKVLSEWTTSYWHYLWKENPSRTKWTFGEGSVLLWGALSYLGKTKPCIVPTKINSENTAKYFKLRWYSIWKNRMKGCSRVSRITHRFRSHRSRKDAFRRRMYCSWNSL